MSTTDKHMKDLIQLNPSQVQPVADLLVRAFQDDPLFVYFFPHASERMNKLSHVLRMLVRYGVLYGEVYATSPNVEGVIVWLPSEHVEMSPWHMMRSGGFSVMLNMSKGDMGRMMRYIEYGSAMHKRHAPFRHWYLQFIGVGPEFRGKGYASVLLTPMFARMNAERLPCYLETQNPQNIPMYQHYGFRVVEEGSIPGSETAHWAMLRQN